MEFGIGVLLALVALALTVTPGVQNPWWATGAWIVTGFYAIWLFTRHRPEILEAISKNPKLTTGCAAVLAALIVGAVWRNVIVPYATPKPTSVSLEVAPLVVGRPRDHPPAEHGKRWIEYGLIAIVRAVNDGDNIRYIHSLRLEGEVGADVQSYVTAARLAGKSPDEATKEFQWRRPFRVIEWNSSPSVGSTTIPPHTGEHFVLFRLVSFGDPASISNLSLSPTGEITTGSVTAGDAYEYFGFRDTGQLPTLKTTVPSITDVLLYSEQGADIIRRPTFRPDLTNDTLRFILELESERLAIPVSGIKELRATADRDFKGSDLRDLFFGLGQYNSVERVPTVRQH
jgi:hypothetical protein